MRPQHRTGRGTAAAVAALTGAVLLAGCGTGGELKSAGRPPTAIGPARLWPELPPASAAPYDYGEGETAHIPGITVPGGDVRLLENLIGNAHRHGSPPVVLTVDGPVVTVRDHGGGFPDYLIAGGPQRFRTEGDTKGHGLGLTIAVGQADVMGAELVLENAPDGGALARLTLPEYVRLDDGDEDPPRSSAGI